MSHSHSHHHSHQHNVVLNLKDLDSTLAASHGGEEAVNFEETANTKNHPSEYETALHTLSKNLKGTKYEAALQRLIKNKEDRSGHSEIEYLPSPEKVKDDVELLKLGRFVTTTTLDSYLEVPAVHSSATKDLAKPLDRNKYKKIPINHLLAGKKSGNGISTNHLGRQRPAVEATGIDNNGELDLQKTVQLASPARERSRLAASASAASVALAKTKIRRRDGTIVDREAALPPTLSSSGSAPGTSPPPAATRVMDSVLDLNSPSASASSLPATSYYQDQSSMSVSIGDFDSWLRTNQSWSQSAASKKQPQRDSKDTAKPKLYKQSAHMKEIYAQKLKAYREHKEEKLLKSFIDKQPHTRTCYDESTNTVQHRPTFKPEISIKSRKMVARRDALEGRTSDVAMANGTYCGPAPKREPLKASLPKFVGLPTSSHNGSKSNSGSRAASPTGSVVAPRKTDLTVNQLNSSSSRHGSPSPAARTTASCAGSPSGYLRFSKPSTPSSERRSRSLSPRLSYTARDSKTPHQRENKPSAFGSSCNTGRFDKVESKNDLHFTERGRSTTRVCNTPFMAPRCSSPTFSQRCCMVIKEGIKSTFRSASEPRERRDFKYMSAEAKRLMSSKQDTFVDRIMASVERYYTRIGTQKEMREKLYGKEVSNALLASVSSTLGHAITNTGLISGGSGGMAPMSILGPGQYSKTEIHGSKGVKSRSATGQRGYSFSKVPRATSLTFANPVKTGGGQIGERTTDWKTDLAKSGAPIHAQIKDQ